MKSAVDPSRPSRSNTAPRPAKFSPAAASFIAAAVADGLSIQHRFKAEPTYGRTGKGYMAPSGVSEIAAAKGATCTEVASSA
jgi:hypothetical protein